MCRLGSGPRSPQILFEYLRLRNARSTSHYIHFSDLARAFFFSSRPELLLCCALLHVIYNCLFSYVVLGFSSRKLIQNPRRQLNFNFPMRFWQFLIHRSSYLHLIHPERSFISPPMDIWSLFACTKHRNTSCTMLAYFQTNALRRSGLNETAARRNTKPKQRR